MHIELTTHTPKGVDKTARYGWVTKDEPGTLMILHKDVLQVQQAYQRTDLLDKRRNLMRDWANFLDKPSAKSSAKVIPLRGKA